MSSTKTRDRRRVLILIKGLGIGGAERLILEGSSQWDINQFHYRVAYVLPWKDHLVEKLTSKGIDTTCVGGTRGLDPITPLRIRRLVKDWGADLIHAHLPSAGILARISSGAPTVYTEHNIVDSYRQPTRSLNRATYGRNSAVIAVSEAVATSLEGYPGPSPVIIPNGVRSLSGVTGNGVRSELGITGQTPLVVHVGNIRPHKGHSNLISATQVLAQRVPEVLVVSIGGEKYSGDVERITRQAEEAGVGERIRFLGKRTDAWAFMAAADVVVNPSDVEGLPLAILEALSMGRPVVATDVGGVSTVVVHRSTGLLISPGDPTALADAVVEALSNPDALEWGRAGARLVKQTHSVTKMIGAYEDVYQDVLDG